jgi:hypothetical protein
MSAILKLRAALAPRNTAFDTLRSMKADKGQFDEVLRRMLNKPPQKTSEIKAEKKREKASKPSQK